MPMHPWDKQNPLARGQVKTLQLTGCDWGCDLPRLDGGRRLRLHLLPDTGPDRLHELLQRHG